MQREAEAARRIQSEFVPRLFDVDCTDDGELFLVMERLYGETLAERLRARSGNLTWEEVRRIGADVLRGLNDAHSARVIHRDLKPGNIFLERLPGGRERARVLDFGVCKLDAQDAESLTSTGEAVGTISYMAPEQIRGASRVDERADIYSFAMVIFEALSGRLAHDASGSIAMIASKLERPARKLREVARVPFPPALDGLLARCLSRKPEDRFPSVAELVRAWEALGHATSVPAMVPIVSQGEVNLPTETGITAMRAASFDRRSGGRWGLVVAAGALVVSTAVLVIGLKLRDTHAAAPPPASLKTGIQAVLTVVPTESGAATTPAESDEPSAGPADSLAEATAADPPEPASLDAPDAGQAKRTRGPRKHPRRWVGSGAAPQGQTQTQAQAQPPKSGAQIQVEPRY
jgi:Protein kinase domain